MITHGELALTAMIGLILCIVAIVLLIIKMIVDR